MKILIEESVLRQALAELERVSNTWCTSSENEITALRSALDTVDTVETVESFYRAAYNKAIEDAAKAIAPSDEHRKDASGGYLGGDEGVELLDNAVDVIRALEMKP